MESLVRYGGSSAGHWNTGRVGGWVVWELLQPVQSDTFPVRSIFTIVHSSQCSCTVHAGSTQQPVQLHSVVRCTLDLAKFAVQTMRMGVCTSTPWWSTLSQTYPHSSPQPVMSLVHTWSYLACCRCVVGTCTITLRNETK